MIKILFISPRYEGGIGGHALRVAEKLKKNNFDVKLMHVPHIPIKKIKNPSFIFFSILKSIFSKEKYDIVHAFNVPSAFAMHYTKSTKKILSVHGVYSDQIKELHSETTSATIDVLESKVLNWADKLTTDSKMVQKQYKEKLGMDFECLYAPLEIEKFKNISKSIKKENQIIYIGRDSYEKGIDILNAKVIYCTNENWEIAMKKLSKSLILIVPSRMESIPQVIKEALFLKIPVIATNVGGIPELITNNETGIIVPPNNPNELLKSINNLLKNKDLSQKIANAGYEFLIRNFTWDVLLPKYIKFYKELIEQK